MKRILWGVSLLLLTGAVFAQPAGVTVTLSASPANSVTVGSPVVLTATVRTPGKGVLLPGAPAPTHYVRDRLRYTFKAQKNWPCPSTTTLAENVSATSGTATPVSATHVSTFSWTPPAAKAGEYSFSVDVTYLTPLVRPVAVQLKGLERVGSATLNYKVKPAPGWSLNVKSDFYPPSPATAPVSLTLNLGFYNPPEFRWYRWKVYCTTGCSPSPQSKDHQGLTTSFQFSIPNPGSYIFYADIDRVVQYQGQSDCTWEQTVSMPHLTPAYYYVNRAP